MASVLLGFAFDDGSFFNSSVPAGTWHHLQNNPEGNFYAIQFASEEASRRGINLTSQNLVKIAEGGMALSSGRPTQQRVLYQTETQATPAQFLPQAVDPQHSLEAVPGPSHHVEDEAMPISWTQPAVLLLIEEVRSHQHLFSSNAFKKNQVWNKVSAAVNEHGYSFSGFVCDKKWRSLNTRFRTIKDKNAKTGQSRTTWAFYDLMEEVNAGNPAVNPPVRISSGGGITVTRRPSEGRSLSPETNQPAAGSLTVPVLQVARSPSEGGSLSPETDQPAEENGPQPDSPEAAAGPRQPASARALLFNSPKLTSRKRKRQEPEPPAWLRQYTEQNSAHMKEFIETAKMKNTLLQRMIEAYEKESN